MEPLKCWKCEGPHLRRNFPLLGESNKDVHNLQEASTVGEIGKFFHWINASLEDRHTDHQSAIIDIKGTISNQNISILIDPGATLSYITPKMMENCQLTKVRPARPWSV